MTALDELRARPVLEVAATVGLRLGRSGSAGPCPACGADLRGADDRRLALGTRRDGRGWRCFRCDVHGDAVALAAWVLLGRLPPAGDPAWRDLGERLGDAPAPRPAPPPAPARPAVPVDDLAGAWESCGLVGDDPEVAAWLVRRGLDVALVEDRDFCRALPVDFSARWAWCPNLTPWSAGWRAVVPRWGPDGALAGLRARWVGVDEAPADVKATGKGSGVMACGLGRQVLACGEVPPWWPAGRQLRVIVAEGEPDWLTWSTFFSDADEAAAAVLGMVEGAWTDAIAARIPDGAEVVIATDPDEKGKRYAARIATSLGGRCVLRRGAAA